MPGGQVEIGELDGRRTSRVEEVAKTLTIPDFTVTVTADIVDTMWQKWVMIATVAAVTSLAGAPPETLPSSPAAPSFKRGRAAGVPVPRLEAAALTLRVHNNRQTADAETDQMPQPR